MADIGRNVSGMDAATQLRRLQEAIDGLTAGRVKPSPEAFQPEDPRISAAEDERDFPDDDDCTGFRLRALGDY